MVNKFINQLTNSETLTILDISRRETWHNYYTEKICYTIISLTISGLFAIASFINAATYEVGPTGRHPDDIRLIQKAIEKGGLDDAGKAHLLLGISYYSDDHPESARTAFGRALKHESTRSDATAWLEHIARQSEDG